MHFHGRAKGGACNPFLASLAAPAEFSHFCRRVFALNLFALVPVSHFEISRCWAKSYCFLLQEDQKPKSLGEVTIDLGEFAKTPSYDERRAFPFTRKKKDVRATLHVLVQAKWLKVDKKPYDVSSGTVVSTPGSSLEDGNDTSESELTHLSNSGDDGSDFDDEDTENPSSLPDIKQSPSASGTTRRKSSKKLNAEAASAAVAATLTAQASEGEPSPRKKSSKRFSTDLSGLQGGSSSPPIPVIKETSSSPRQRTSSGELEKSPDGAAKEKSISRRSSSKDKMAGGKEKDKDKEKSKEKEKKKKSKPRPFSMDMTGLKLDSTSGDAPAVDNKAARPLASHSSLGALALSPGGQKLTSDRAPLAKKQRRRSLEPGSQEALAVQAAIAANKAQLDSTAPSDSGAAAPGSTTLTGNAIASVPLDLSAHTEKKIQQEVDMAHEEVRSLRKELMAAQQKIRALEQDRQRLLQAASALQMAQITPPAELVALQDKCATQEHAIAQQQASIVTLKTELARAKASSTPWFDARASLPPVELPRIISREDENHLLMVVLLIMLVLSILSYLFSPCASPAAASAPLQDSAPSL